MTFDLPAMLAIAGACSGVTAYIVRSLVLNRIDGLEQSRDAMGARFGEGQKKTEIWQAQHDAVELHKQGRWPR